MFVLYAGLITFLYDVGDLKWLQLPWPPIALLGTAVAFIIGFQNNATHMRVSSARQIWGEIGRTVRQWAAGVMPMVNGMYAKEDLSNEQLATMRMSLVHKSLGWITALRHEMRMRRPWEVIVSSRSSREWTNNIYHPERASSMEQDLASYLNEEELDFVRSKRNKASAVVALISAEVEDLYRRGFIWEFNYLHLQAIIKQMITSQGKTEGIKNFPYPRQYVTLSYYLVWVLVILLPLGLLPAFNQLDIALHAKYGYFEHTFIWLAVPFCTVVSWAFHTIQKIGLVGENPFEGTVNDVPISAISRGIEIEVLQMAGVGEDDLPAQFPVHMDVVL